MTEREWHECRESARMLDFLRGKASARKLRLLACALVRSVRLFPTGRTAWDLLKDCEWFLSSTRFPITEEPCRDLNWLPPDGPGDGYGYLYLTAHQVIEAMEDHADGRISTSRLAAVEGYCSWIRFWAEADTFKPDIDPPNSRFHEALALTVADTSCSDELLIQSLESPNWYSGLKTPPDDYEGGPYDKDHEDQVCGTIREIFNPFRPRTIAKTHHLRPSLLPMQCVYDARAFDILTTLPGRFECASGGPDISAHLSSESPHFRGCWAMDELLGLS